MMMAVRGTVFIDLAQKQLGKYQTGSPPDFRSQTRDQCPEKSGFEPFFSLRLEPCQAYSQIIVNVFLLYFLSWNMIHMYSEMDFTKEKSFSSRSCVGAQEAPPKSLDSDENFKPEPTLFCRELRFVAIYALFGVPFFGQKQCFLGKKFTLTWYILHILLSSIC